MGEDEARAWLKVNNVSRETISRLEHFVELIIAANSRQNLISATTIDAIWARHIVDSAQLVAHAQPGGSWADLGSGAGLPGLVIGLLHRGNVTLIEQRKLRVDFLEEAVQSLELAGKVRVVQANVRSLRGETFEVISARAFAPLDRLFAAAHHLSENETRWVLPKGRQAKTELEAARASWQGVFRLEPSITDQDASIVVAEQVRPLAKRKRAP